MGAAAAAGIGAAGAIGAAGIGALGAKGGSGQSSYADIYAAQLQYNTQQQMLANAQPFINIGSRGANMLLGDLTGGNEGTPYGPPIGMPMDLSGMPTSGQVPQFNWNPTMEGLAQTPGYQFTLQQGLQATQNAAAARGQGVSGPALRGAADYATGLASTTYNQQLQNAMAVYGQQLAGFNTQASQFQNQFQDYWANQNNRYQQLSGLATLGSNAAVGAGTNATNAMANVGNALTASGQAQAAGTMGAANAISGGINNALTNPATQSYLTSLFSGGGSTIGFTGSGNNQQYALSGSGPFVDTGSFDL